MFDVSRRLPFSHLIRSGSISQAPSRWGWEGGGGTRDGTPWELALSSACWQVWETRVAAAEWVSPAVCLHRSLSTGRRCSRDRQPRDWLCLHHGRFGACLGRSPSHHSPHIPGHPALGWACRGSPSSPALWGCWRPQATSSRRGGEPSGQSAVAMPRWASDPAPFSSSQSFRREGLEPPDHLWTAVAPGWREPSPTVTALSNFWLEVLPHRDVWETGVLILPGTGRCSRRPSAHTLL